MGLTLANEVGGNPKLLSRKKVPRDNLTVFQPWKNSGNMAKVINVDVTTHKGIEGAIKLGFLTKEGQPKTDFVSSSLFHLVSMKLFSNEQKARMFALFRNPVERAVSKFYYLSKGECLFLKREAITFMYGTSLIVSFFFLFSYLGAIL